MIHLKKKKEYKSLKRELQMTIDALPGKQLLIDRDAQKGLLTKEEVKKKRQELQFDVNKKEGMFHSFVKKSIVNRIIHQLDSHKAL